MNYTILAVVVIYFLIVIGIGYFYYHRSTSLSDYILGGRTLNPYVTALSAQASDMSGWLLMGLPGSILVAGLGEIWIGIGLAVGSYLAWLFIAKRLRVYTEVSKNSLTLSSFFSNRFGDKKGYLRDVSAIIILVFFTIYVGSGFVAAGKVFNLIFNDISSQYAILLAAAVIVIYTFLGGFKAVCWTDFLQGMLMIIALVVVPIAAIAFIGGWADVGNIWDQISALSTAEFTNIMYDGGEKIGAVALVSLFGWGLGYFGMPHIVVRYTAIKNPNEMKIARRVATIWVVICLAAAAMVGLVGRAWLVSKGIITAGTPVEDFAGLFDAESIFITMAGGLFATVFAAIVYSAVLAAVMSTADSQLLVASSAVSNDLYKRFKHKEPGMNDKQLMWLSRGVVAVIAVLGAVIALTNNPSIMSLVSFAWAGFGSAFGALVVCALFWKRANAPGAIAGMLVGFFVAILWNTFLVTGGFVTKVIGTELCVYNTGLYELIPGFFLSLLAIIVVSLVTKKPEADIAAEYEAYEAEMAKLDGTKNNPVCANCTLQIPYVVCRSCYTQYDINEECCPKCKEANLHLCPRCWTKFRD